MTGITEDPGDEDVKDLLEVLSPTLQVPVCYLDKPNKNGRVYPAALMRRVVHEAASVLPVMAHMPALVDRAHEVQSLDGVVGWASNAAIVDDRVCFCVTLFDPVMRELLMDGRVSLRTSGVGGINKGVIENYSLRAIFLTDDPA